MRIYSPYRRRAFTASSQALAAVGRRLVSDMTLLPFAADEAAVRPASRLMGVLFSSLFTHWPRRLMPFAAAMISRWRRAIRDASLILLAYLAHE